jgi:phenylalanyl-tRNA synthetase alpha chain
MSEQLANIALGWMVKKGWCQIKKEGGLLTIKMRTLPPEGLDENILRLARLKGEIDSTDMTPEKLETAKTLVKRKLLIEREVITRTIKLTDYAFHEIKKGIKPKIEVTRLTSELITSGKWKEVKLREYDVTASPPMIYPGKKQFYLEFLEDVKRVLLSLGFVEAEGPYVETEFWNFDVLFQAQDHPAREIHDSYTLKHPKQGVISENEKLVERVKKTHENGWTTGSLGWRYKWSIEVASRLILRTQTTAVSMRYLAEHKEPPVKMFCISRVFRPDVLDAKHSMEFLQCEGIVMDKGLTFRHLLGFLNEFAKALDLGKIIFKPGYFPFTEPSVESFVKHPKLGWIEFVGAGMFRPEVLQPLEINYPVLAWGIGMDRIAMASLEVDDIRDLFSKRLDFLRRK